MLVRITGKGFVAGVVVEDDVVRRAAPILKWARGMTADELRMEVARRGLKATLVRTLRRAEIRAGGESDESDEGDEG